MRLILTYDFSKSQYLRASGFWPTAGSTRFGLLCALAIATLCAISSCGPADDGFVAVQADFAPYRTWMRYDLGASPIAGHPAGPRRAFVNQGLPAGATAYPVGTIIVKEIQTVAPLTVPSAYELFAMVKRGGTYNSMGAVGWEFFTLRLDASGTPEVVARGQNPSSGDIYSTTAGEPGCNSCHAAAGTEHTDHILDTQLQPPPSGG